MQPVIEIQQLTKDYGGHKGVFDISFSVSAGEVFGFLGPNGAGKTTTIRQLMGFIRPDGGSCTIGGMDCWKDAAKIQSRVGYIPGEAAFIDEMRGKEFLAFIGKYRGQYNPGRIDALCERFELDASGKIKKMSKGMKQKVGIVCAFMHDPDILVLDEPSSGLDPLMQNRFIELVLEEKQRGKTVLMSSHIFEEVARTSDRVGIIKQGELVDVQDTHALKSAKRRVYLVTLQDMQAAEAFKQGGFEITSQNGNQLSVMVEGNVPQFIQRLTQYPVVDLDVATQSLEDLFMHHYGGDYHVQ
ncbi:ABC transporter ATP-binding protein [Eubacteriales bacterium OttesenSCG-928-N14]|nr:ABC transporter ATP-binding protein [Eubacteriales bacterium OttesenSCG-928-N14]